MNAIQPRPVHLPPASARAVKCLASALSVPIAVVQGGCSAAMNGYRKSDIKGQIARRSSFADTSAECV
jgi:hypothetical protein